MLNILIVNESTKLVLRAGYANVIIFFALLAAALSNVIVSQITQTLWIRGIAIAVIVAIFARLYWSAVSKIEIGADKVVITMSLATKTIPTSDIVGWKLFEFPLGYAIFIRFKLVSKRMPFSFSFVAPFTNQGDIRSTATFLRENLERNICSSSTNTDY